MSVLISTTLAEALGALAAEPSSMVLAGGTDVMVEVNGGHRRPEAVIAVGRVPELRTWSHDTQTVDTAHRRGGDLRRDRTGTIRAMGPGAQPGGAHRWLATDPACGNARGQRGNMLARW